MSGASSNFTNFLQKCLWRMNHGEDHERVILKPCIDIKPIKNSHINDHGGYLRHPSTGLTGGTQE